jgi:hypothetical protein
MHDAAQGKIPESYFEEKKESALNCIQYSASYATEAAGMIQAMSYSLPSLLNHKAVHEALMIAESNLRQARLYFETARWSSTALSENIEFDAWLIQQGYRELSKSQLSKSVDKE